MQLVEYPPSFGQQGADPFHGIDLIAHPGKNCRLVPGTGTDFENFFIPLQLEGLGHVGHNIGLGNGLSGPDRQGMIAVGPAPHGIVDEQVPGDFGHRLDGSFIEDVPAQELLLNHSYPAGCVRIHHLLFLCQE
ncbi:MAG: hypothetical protein ACD_75C01535G0003 [uncultured bacterium]|nr:MAG: hypothetical protein ACD_75C01535G0003 [uncultured bacterium]